MEVEDFSGRGGGAVSCNIGSRADSPFWHCCWAANQPLTAAFPELYMLAGRDGLSVADAGIHTSTGWVWNGNAIFEDVGAVKDFLWQEMYLSIQHIIPNPTVKDSFVWSITNEGVFTVKSCYERFKAKLFGLSIDPSIVKAASLLWKVKTPSKLLFFGWRIIHNRIASKAQLHKRGILDSSVLNYVFCSVVDENLSHLLGGCVVVVGVWKKVFEWIGAIDVLSLEEFFRFPFAMHKVKSTDCRATIAVIWLATVWGIWLERNAIIFK
ncbi:uncharacterized protein LOC131657849 [Vicia villosa]|uniref:uncharacterized protein LOC131657849 n=1 Tax=Vicia villosa TaxID=3911 RepID=UPI00273AF255|nr:uncharacterized protein LOC131657849 [Vicia villosa]